jgi:hypothetical protein
VADPRPAGRTGLPYPAADPAAGAAQTRAVPPGAARRPTGASRAESTGGWSGEGGFSKGPRTGDTTEIGFRYGTAVNEYLGWMVIPKQTAIAAALEFFHTGKQPTNVEWDDRL